MQKLGPDVSVVKSNRTFLDFWNFPVFDFFFSQFFLFSLTWDPMGAKPPKRYFSLKSLYLVLCGHFLPSQAECQSPWASNFYSASTQLRSSSDKYSWMTFVFGIGLPHTLRAIFGVDQLFAVFCGNTKNTTHIQAENPSPISVIFHECNVMS